MLEWDEEWAILGYGFLRLSVFGMILPRSCLWLHKWVVAENGPRQSWCWLHRQIDRPFVDRQNIWQRFDLVT